jgi:hypothetical protein
VCGPACGGRAAKAEPAVDAGPAAPQGAALLLSTLGVSATDPARYAWEPVAPTDPDHMEHTRRLLHAVADRARWQAALAEARRKAQEATGDLSATGRAA